jgi:anti-sigma28 factor (negative regulator of flagellin synthesis)
MDQDSLRRGRIRLVTSTGEKSSPGEADVRWSRVEAARARIAAGFYDRADVREKLLDAILDELTDR